MPTPPRVHLGWVATASALMLTAELSLLLALGHDWRAALVPGAVTLLVVFGTVFAVAAVTVAGFVGGAAGAALLLLGAVGLPVLLAVTAVLAVLCGFSPGWVRVEVWQAARSPGRIPDGGAAAAQAPMAGVARPGWRRPPGRRPDRVLAAFLVLSYPAVFAALSVLFLGWATTR